MPTYAVNHKLDKVVPSPVTPAVTGIDYPSNEDASTELDSYRPPRGFARGLYTHPNIAGSTIDDVEPPVDARSLDLLWGSIRQEKEKKMAKERPKVQSLEEIAQDLLAVDQIPVQVPVMESPPVSVPKSMRKQKSMYVLVLLLRTALTLGLLGYRSNFRESTDGRAIVATFDLPEVAKQDIHISFQRNKLVLTWETGEITEWEEEDGVVLREHVRKMYNRTIPLPEGTRVRNHEFRVSSTADRPIKFEEIHAQMTSRGLILRYPNMRCYRVEARSRSGDS